MIEYEKRLRVDLAGRSPYAFGTVAGVPLQISDWYPMLAAGPGSDDFVTGIIEPVGFVMPVPVLRFRRTREAGRESWESTVKISTPDPAARLEYTYPLPGGMLAPDDTIPQAHKMRFRLSAVGSLAVPAGLAVTLDVFSHPNAGAYMEIEGEPGAVDAFARAVVPAPTGANPFGLAPVDRKRIAAPRTSG